MKSVDENNDNKIGRKHKTWSKKFHGFFVICDLRMQKTFKGQIVFNLKFKKTIYMKIDSQLAETITLISNDVDP